MVITKILGGIGNQLFQYAVGKRLSVQNNTELLLDTSSFEDYKWHTYSLFNFNISGKVADKKEIQRFHMSGFKKIISDILSFKDGYKIIKEKTYKFDEKYLKKAKNIYLDGYWQSPKYFTPIESILKKEIKIKDNQGQKYNELIKKISGVNSVSLHVRRGNYLENKHKSVFESIPMEYYEKAVKLIADKVKNIEIFIFSDDIEWVKKNINLPHTTNYASDGSLKDYQELMLISNCKHNITANSTFSWWGAWLNENPNKIVVTPKKWFVKKDMPTDDLIPKNWIMI